MYVPESRVVLTGTVREIHAGYQPLIAGDGGGERPEIAIPKRGAALQEGGGIEFEPAREQRRIRVAQGREFEAIFFSRCLKHDARQGRRLVPQGETRRGHRPVQLLAKVRAIELFAGSIVGLAGIESRAHEGFGRESEFQDAVVVGFYPGRARVDFEARPVIGVQISQAGVQSQAVERHHPVHAEAGVRGVLARLYVWK